MQSALDTFIVSLAVRTITAMIAVCITCCVGSPESTEWTNPTARFDSDEELLPAPPSFEEFAEDTRVALGDRSGFRVEGDMLIETQAELEVYYTQRFLGDAKKSIVNLVGGSPARDIRADSNAVGSLTDIRYCLGAGNWGGTESGDTDGDGIMNEPLPTSASVLAALRVGMRDWQTEANVRFTEVTSSCNFAVVLDVTQSCLATGPFPSAATQQLTVPICGLPGLLAHHEVGHALGLRHEHIHTDASPRCSEGGAEGTNWEELTNFDTNSALKYQNCTTGSFIANVRVSRLDGVGLRELYGPPDWWRPVL